MTFKRLSNCTPPGVPLSYYSAKSAKLLDLSFPLLGLVGAWEADYGITLDTTNSVTTVSAMLDQSSTGVANTNNAVQPTKASQPRLIKSVLNGYPALRFNGTSSFLKTGGASYAAKMIIALFRQNNFADYDGIVTCRTGENANKNSSSNEESGCTGITGTFNIAGFGSSDAIYTDGVAKTVTDYNNFQVGVNLVDNTNFHLTEAIKVSSVVGNKFWTIGTDTFSSGRFFSGDLVMLLMYNVFDDTTRLNARKFANEKYALGLSAL